MRWDKLLFSFHGRLNRQGFWIGVGINFAFLFVLVNFLLNLTAYSAISLLPLLFSLYSLSAIIVKRLHDRNRSGKALCMALVPALCYVSSFYAANPVMAQLLGRALPIFILTTLVLEWGVFKGTNGSNAYGERGLSLKIK